MLTSIPNPLKPVKGCQKIVNTEGHTEKILHVFKKKGLLWVTPFLNHVTHDLMKGSTFSNKYKIF